jgi:putative ABC transport system substrate-binding protein
MRRRKFIGLLVGAVVSWPLKARAQRRDRMRRIGVLMHLAVDDPEGQSRFAAFLQGLQEAGWAVGRNLTIDVRCAAADVELMKRSAKELVALQPDLLFTSSTPAAAAMLQATRTIPVVFVLVADPIGTALIASLPRPGGNMTGFAPIVPSLGGKWTELVKEIAPRTNRVTMLFNPPSATFIESFVKPLKAAASSFGMEAIVAPVDNMDAVESLVAVEASQPDSALVVIPDAFTELHRAEIVSLTVHRHVPAINWARSFAESGGLISYGPNLIDEYRRGASYADRILKGESPSELPVQTPVKFELVINMKTAQMLGLDVSPAFQSRADDVIE